MQLQRLLEAVVRKTGFLPPITDMESITTRLRLVEVNVPVLRDECRDAPELRVEMIVKRLLAVPVDRLVVAVTRQVRVTKKMWFGHLLLEARVPPCTHKVFATHRLVAVAKVSEALGVV